jgi:hypothetical protein
VLWESVVGPSYAVCASQIVACMRARKLVGAYMRVMYVASKYDGLDKTSPSANSL